MAIAGDVVRVREQTNVVSWKIPLAGMYEVSFRDRERALLPLIPSDESLPAAGGGSGRATAAAAARPTQAQAGAVGSMEGWQISGRRRQSSTAPASLTQALPVANPLRDWPCSRKPGSCRERPGGQLTRENGKSKAGAVRVQAIVRQSPPSNPRLIRKCGNRPKHAKTPRNHQRPPPSGSGWPTTTTPWSLSHWKQSHLPASL
ncbi:hypothetical protein B0J14DRAFT_111331 [Halenospora varia]|nr:hypothetical protein B0J14DRAFT_111331 [Halenospora varia]